MAVTCGLRALVLAATAAAASIVAPAAEAAPAVAIRVSLDTEGPSTRVMLTASRTVAAVITASGGRIEVAYSEPVEVSPREGRPRDPILASWTARGDRSVVFETGPGYRSYESFQLKNPARVVLDLAGDRPTRSVGARARSAAVPPKFVIVVDPGHGGVEVGARGPSGLEEKDVTLDLARRLKDVLQQEPGVGVVLTRDEDQVVPLDERTAIANHNRADLFLSIHLNSARGRKAVGSETYYVSADSTDDESRTVAALENRAYGDSTDQPGRDAMIEPGLELVLWDLAQTQFLAQSSRLAESVQTELNALAGIRSRGVRQAPFRVLMGATMPAILVEAGFISNPDEESRFRSDDYKGKVVEAIARAIRQFREGVVRLEDPGGGGPAPGRRD